MCVRVSIVGLYRDLNAFVCVVPLVSVLCVRLNLSCSVLYALGIEACGREVWALRTTCPSFHTVTLSQICVASYSVFVNEIVVRSIHNNKYKV